jgi:sporulation protein YlmC with PRC-barrel domain
MDSRRHPADEPARAPMLRRVTHLLGWKVTTAEGDVGSLDDLSFDDESWTVRYVVVDVGSWLQRRSVLLSPLSIERFDPAAERLVTRLTKSAIERSPDIDTARPVSRQHESDLLLYYGYAMPYYWEGPYRWGGTAAPMAEAMRAAPPDQRNPIDDNPHLRSVRAVRGYGIRATDGDLGHVEDFLVDEESWAIRYLIVDPRNWWPGAHVLMAVDWITDVDWRDSVVAVKVTREAVRNAPEFRPAEPLDRDYESRLHGHYGAIPYWELGTEAWRLERRGPTTPTAEDVRRGRAA